MNFRICSRRRSVAALWAAVCAVATVGCAQETSESAPSLAKADKYVEAPGEGPIACAEPGWAQWRGPRRDGISNEKGLLKKWPNGGPKLLWKAEGIGRGWSSPMIVDGRLYITGDIDDDLVIFAMDTDGRVIWRGKNGRAWNGSYPGSRACCALSEGRLYNLNGHGRLNCLDCDDGEELWSINILEKFQGKNNPWAVSECLLIDGNNVIVTPVGRKALIAALDKRTGKTRWKTPRLGDDRVTHTSPILFRFGGRRIIAQCSSAHGFGVDADTGELLWTVPLENQYGVTSATPIYGAGGVFYVTPYTEHGRLYQLRRTDDGIDAMHQWTNRLDTSNGSGVFFDGMLYSSGYRKNKWFIAADWTTGEFRHELKEFTVSAPIHADGHIYVLDEDGFVGLLKADKDSLEIVGRFQLVQNERRVRDAWAHPVLLDGHLYLRYHDTLWCFDVRER